MRVIKNINISDIEMDRHPLNSATLNLIRFLENGGTVPPIKVAKKANGGFIIRDGRHRITANKLMGKTTIQAKFSTKVMVK